MIRSKLWPFLGLIWLGVASCGGKDVCERAAELDCDDPPPDVEQCQENLESDCSEEEVEHFEAYFDCLVDSDLLCELDPTPGEADVLEDCYAELESVSYACLVLTSTS